MASSYDESDDDGPLSKLFPPPEQPKRVRTPIPLPENVRHLYPSAGTPQIANKTYSAVPSYTSPYAVSSSSNDAGKVYPPFPTSTSRPGVKSYIPIPGGFTKDAHGFQSPNSEKRRKLSTPSNPTPIRVGNHIGHASHPLSTMPGAGVPGAGHQQAVGQNASVQSLNKALTTNSAVMHSIGDLAAQPRPLQLTKAPEVGHSTHQTLHTPAFPLNSNGGASIRSHPYPPSVPIVHQTRRETKASESGSLLNPARFMVESTPTVPHASVSASQNTAASASQNSTPFRPAPTHSEALPVALKEEEEDFLIFLKEVKKLQWKEITKVYNQYYTRSYPKLQSHYSTKLNKRDRSKDRLILKVPAVFASEAAATWPAVRAGNLDHAPIQPAKPDVEHVQVKHEQVKQKPPSPAWQTPVASVEYPSGSEDTAIRRERPRRAVPVKDYTWSKLRDPQSEEQEQFVTSMGRKSEEPPESLKSAPEQAIPIDNVPMIPYSFEKEDALLGISAQTKQAKSQEKLPYLSTSERSIIHNIPLDQEWDQLSSRDWQGSLVHVDFSPDELEIVQKVAYKVLNTPRQDRRKYTRRHLQKLLQSLSDPTLLHIISEARRRLPSRDGKSLKAFLTDAQIGQIKAKRPLIERLAAARLVTDYSTVRKTSITSMVGERELGLKSRRGWKATSQPVSYQMKNKIKDSLGPSFTYTGASGDVHAVAWSPDGETFVAGAICVDDPHSMQYNKGNNLLYGDLTHNAIHELGGHSVRRPQTESGPNSTHAMFVSQDPKLYKTVSSVLFSPDGRYVYSGGYDHKVCIWETKPQEDRPNFNQPKWSGAWKHKAPIDIMAINSSGLLATASKKPSTNAVKTIRMLDNDCRVIEKSNFSSQKATNNPNHHILPTALHFSPREENLLLAGFGANVNADGRDLSGDMCLWDVNRPKQLLNIIGSSKNVFDLAFHPRHRWFAAGCVAGPGVNRGTRSVLRLHDEVDAGKYSMRMELECKALDMNDITWCPGSDHLIAAGCTSGRAYVWDVRWPENFLRELAHAHSLMPLDDYIDREITDTGIRFLSWGDNATRLYTGSSDGVVKVWNVAASEEDTFVKDLITTESGIMSGAFSPDKSKLILGDINGSINVLEVGQEDCSLKEASKFSFIPYDETAEKQDNDEAEAEDSQEGPLTPPPSASDSGISAANELLHSSQMLHKPLGGLPIRQAVQGPNYQGPFDTSIEAPFLRQQALAFQLSLSAPTAPQCALPLCKDAAIVRITSEEVGDSRRSQDRIPDALRLQRKTTLASSLTTPIPGKARCERCAGVARPDASSPDGAILCERCSFTCFRCCKPFAVAPATETLTCPHCGGVWDVGALGFEAVGGTKGQGRIWPDLDGIVPGLSGLLLRGHDHDAEEDEQETDDYYFRLALDRPESPPL